MTDLQRRLAELSPQKRAAFERLIKARKGEPDGAGGGTGGAAGGTGGADRAGDGRRSRSGAARLRQHGLGPRPAGRPVPLAYGQRRLWLLDQFTPGNPAYNETNSLRFRFPLDVDVLRRAVNEIVRRHEALRTSVEVTDGTPFLRFAEALVIPIPAVELSHLPAAEREAEVLHLAAEQSRAPFDLSEGPLLRCSVLRLGADDAVFVLSMHHIVCDGWSMGVFMVELLALYWSFLTGKPSPLPELRVQYGDFAAWQREAVSPDVEDGQLAYWRSQLADLPTIELPADRPRPPVFIFRGSRHPLRITGDTYASLVRLVEQQGVTLFMVLLTAFAALLYRYTDEDDLCIGTPSAGRSSKELEPLIGFFVNTLVMRLRVDRNATFLDLLDDVRRTAVDAFSNEDIPFDRLVEELQPARDKSRNPLFQVMFQLFQAPTAVGLRKDLLLPFTPVDSGISKVDLSLELIRTDEAISGHFEYNSDLFDAARIERMGGHFTRLLESALADPQRLLSELEMLSPAEKDQLLHEWNRTAVPYGADRTIPEIFDEQAAGTPDATAVRFGERSLSYGQLGAMARSVAGELGRHGLGAGDLVGLYLERCLELPAALLGTLVAGSGYVPLDPGYPADRIDYLIADSGLRAILTTGARAGDLATFAGPVIAVDQLARAAPPPTRGSRGLPTDIAYVMYTSGTTGRPKGVAVTHRNILRLVQKIGYVDLGGEQVVLHFAPISFDASTFELWGPLLNGGTVAIHPPGVPSLEELGAFVRREQIDLLFLTTALFTQLVERNPADLRAVRQVVTGGETLFASVAQAAWRALPRSLIRNAYGPTECTTFATMYPIGGPETLADPMPIGRPIENTTAYVLDRQGQLVPVGVPGELCLGGDGVAAGYWNRPELSDERFVPDPFSGRGRMYRTGDVVRYRDDGNIVFLGRRDRQIKLNGYRIELGEVETAILSHPDVRAAVVVVATEPRRLAAFYETAAGGQPEPAALRAHLSSQLPAYMVPSDVERLDHMPLTPNGKVDTDSLAHRPRGTSPGPQRRVPPATPTEHSLADIWSEVLKLDPVGVTDNFFELGGQSLLATRILSRVRTAFGVPVSMREFFDNPTIAAFAEVLARAEPTGSSTPAAGVPERKR